MGSLSQHSLTVDGSQRGIRFATRYGVFGFTDRHVGTGRLVRAQVREDQGHTDVGGVQRRTGDVARIESHDIAVDQHRCPGTQLVIDVRVERTRNHRVGSDRHDCDGNGHHRRGEQRHTPTQ